MHKKIPRFIPAVRNIFHQLLLSRALIQRESCPWQTGHGHTHCLRGFDRIPYNAVHEKVQLTGKDPEMWALLLSIEN